MTADHLIENREVLRERPPDILLTNYKMLDLLLTQPVDSRLLQYPLRIRSAPVSGAGVTVPESPYPIVRL